MLAPHRLACHHLANSQHRHGPALRNLIHVGDEHDVVGLRIIIGGSVAEAFGYSVSLRVGAPLTSTTHLASLASTAVYMASCTRLLRPSRKAIL